jgi:ABC-type phosphate transport system permease subunit
LPAWIYGVFKIPQPTSYAVYVKLQNVAFAGSLVLVAIFLAITITALLVRNHLSKKLAGA